MHCIKASSMQIFPLIGGMIEYASPRTKETAYNSS